MSIPRFQLVPGARLAGTPGHGGVGWRLLGANNRELGRCAAAYPDATAATEGIEEARRGAVTAVARISHEAGVGSWTWSLIVGDTAIATSGRGFRHERECRYNLEQFRDCAPVSALIDAPVPELFPWQRTVVADMPPGVIA